MESLDILLPIAIIIVIIAVSILLWAINNGQFDDLESPAQTILFDDIHFTNEGAGFRAKKKD